MKLDVGSGDERIREIVAGWSFQTQLGFFLIALFGAVPIIQWLAYLIPFDSVRLALFRLDGFASDFFGTILLIFFLLYKRGYIADTIFSAPANYKTNLKNVWLRFLIYTAVILAVGLAQVYNLAYLFNIGPKAMKLTGDLGGFLVFTLIVPITEEIYSRFLALYIISRWSNRLVGVTVSVFLFTIGHYSPTMSDKTQNIILGTLWALVTMKFGTLWPSLAMHSWNNMIVYFIKSWRLPLF